MKKIYFTPDTKVVKVRTNYIMAGSLTGTLDPNAEITESNGFGSRRGGGFWEDDEE